MHLIRKFCNALKFSSKEVICWGTGNALREFMHVDDLGKAILFALENWDPKSIYSPRDSFNEPLTYLNVGTGKDMTIKELALLIAEIVVSVIKHEDWLARGDKNDIGLKRPAPNEIDLQKCIYLP